MTFVVECNGEEEIGGVELGDADDSAEDKLSADVDGMAFEDREVSVIREACCKSTRNGDVTVGLTSSSE